MVGARIKKKVCGAGVWGARIVHECTVIVSSARLSLARMGKIKGFLRKSWEIRNSDREDGYSQFGEA